MKQYFSRASSDVINRLTILFRGKPTQLPKGSAFFPALALISLRAFPKLLRGLWFSVIADVKFPFFLGKNVFIYASRQLHAGKGFYLGDYCMVNLYSKHGVFIGENVTIREFGWIQLTSLATNPGDSIVIGDNTYIGPRAYLGAGAKIQIGACCQIGANVSIIAESHGIVPGKSLIDQSTDRLGVSIGDDCWIGNNVVILDGVNIGEGCVIGASSVVTRNVEPYSVVAGVPARKLRSRG